MKAVFTLINKDCRRVIFSVNGMAITVEIDKLYPVENIIHAAPIDEYGMSKSFSNEGLDWQEHEIPESVSDMRAYFFNLFKSVSDE